MSFLSLQKLAYIYGAVFLNSVQSSAGSIRTEKKDGESFGAFYLDVLANIMRVL